MKMDIKNINCGYGEKTIVSNVTMEICSGDVLCLLGPNGVGKTTFFKTILGFLKLQSGQILFDGKDIKTFSQRELAKKVAYIPQAHTPPFPFKVIDVVVMGRTAYIGAFSEPSRKDVRIAEEALETLNMSYLRDYTYTQISGGEKQLVLIARALAQQPELLIMDEPTSSLDFGNQVRVLKHINNLSKGGMGIIVTTHFPNHVFLSGSKVAIFKDGKMIKSGVPHEIITGPCLEEIYGIETEIVSANIKGRKDIKYCVPIME